MTRIDFYVGAEDPLRTLCQVAGKALAARLRLFVLTPDAATSERVDRALWLQPPTGFLPHCRRGHPLEAVTPIVVDHTPAPLPVEQVLVNLCAEAPECFSRFERLVEIVGPDPGQRAQARERFRFYRERGYEIRTHDLAAPAAAGR